MPKLENLTIEERKNPNIFKKITDFGGKFIDYKWGLVGAGVMGGIVFGINYSETSEILGSTTAALKQGGYTFLFGGAVMKGCEYLATKIKKQTIAIAASIIIPSIVTTTLTYGLHNLKGTPKPIESTIPTLITVIPATAFLGSKKRKQKTIKYIALTEN